MLLVAASSARWLTAISRSGPTRSSRISSVPSVAETMRCGLESSVTARPNPSVTVTLNASAASVASSVGSGAVSWVGCSTAGTSVAAPPVPQAASREAISSRGTIWRIETFMAILDSFDGWLGTNSQHPQHVAVAVEQEHKKRRTDQGGDDANLKLDGLQNQAGDGVRADQKSGPRQGAGRKQQAVVGADDQAQHVRHDQPDEANRPGDADRRPGRQRRQPQQQQASARHIDAETLGRLLAEQQQVDVAGEDQQYGEGDGDREGDGPEMRPAAPAQPADQPAQDGLDFDELIVEQQQRRDQRTQQRIHGDPGQQQRGGLGMAAHQRHQVDAGGRSHRPQEGEDRHDPQVVSGKAGGDGDDRAQRSADADADDGRIG